jgi:hypothetical protein
MSVLAATFGQVKLQIELSCRYAKNFETITYTEQLESNLPLTCPLYHLIRINFLGVTPVTVT